MQQMERRWSARLDRERVALERLVAAEFEQQEVEDEVHGDGPGAVQRQRRGSSAYLPVTHDRSRANLRVAQRVLQTMYALYRRYDRQHLLETAAFAVAMTGIFLVVLDNEYVDSRAGKLVLRTINAILTAALLGFLLWRFAIVREILIQRNAVPPHVPLYRMPLGRLAKLALELAVCAVCVPPGLGNATFTVWEWKTYADARTNPLKPACDPPFVADNGGCYLVYSYPVEVLGLLSLLRLYMIPRVIRNMSAFTSYRTSYLGALHRVDTMSSLFAVKCFLHAHPFKFLLAAFLSIVLLTGYALAIIEGPSNPSVAPLSNALWLVVITMGTVGYGDVMPATVAGEVLLVIGGMLSGIMLVGALSAALFGFLSLNERDQRFVQLIHHHEATWKLRDACARSIQAAWSCHLARSEQRDGDGTWRQRRELSSYSNRVYQCTAWQRKLRWRQTGVSYNKDAVSEVRDCQEQLLFSLRNEHAATMKRLRLVEARLDALLVAATATTTDRQ